MAREIDAARSSLVASIFTPDFVCAKKRCSVTATSRARLPYASGDGRAGMVSIFDLRWMSSGANAREIPGWFIVTVAEFASNFFVVLRIARSQYPVGFAAGLNESAVLWCDGSISRKWRRTRVQRACATRL